MIAKIEQLVNTVHRKRSLGQILSTEDLYLLLADSLIDQRLFLSPNWKYLYGGVRYAPSAPSNNRPGKILVLQWPSPLGDTAMCANFFSVLRQKYPHSEISFLSGQNGLQLHRSNPCVDVLIDNPLEPYFKAISQKRPVKLDLLLDHTRSFVNLLRDYRYDLLINLHVLPMCAVLARLLEPLETIGMTLTDDGMPLVKGNIWALYLFGVSANLMRHYNTLHRSEIFRLMIDGSKKINPDFNYIFTEEIIDNVQKQFDAHGIKDNDFVVGMSPLSKWPSKVWNKFDVLSKRLEEIYGAKIVMFGAQEDEAKIHGISKKSNVNVLEATYFNINELLAAICGCDLFITNDTGPMHLACSLKKKVIALFGPTNAQEVGPWGTDSLILQSSQCKGCMKPVCDKDNFCMDHISVDDVIKSVEALINRKSPQVANKISSFVNIYLSEKENFPSALHELISKAYLIYFTRIDHFVKNVVGSIEVHSRVNDGEIRTLLKECSYFKGRLKSALSALEDCNYTTLQDTNRYLTRYNGFLKNIEVVNSTRHIEKRNSKTFNKGSWKKYYSGMLNDINCFSKLLKSGCSAKVSD